MYFEAIMDPINKFIAITEKEHEFKYIIESFSGYFNFLKSEEI